MCFYILCKNTFPSYVKTKQNKIKTKQSTPTILKSVTILVLIDVIREIAPFFADQRSKNRWEVPIT